MSEMDEGENRDENPQLNAPQAAPAPGADRVTELTAQEKYKHALKAVHHIPEYDGSIPYRTYEPTYCYYATLNFFEFLPDAHRKMTLLTAMRGDAQTKTRNLRPGTPIYDNNTFNDYAVEVYKIFAPPQESELARAEFNSRTQGRREDISSYLSEKFSLFDSSFPPDEQNFYILLQETIRGIYSPIIKRMVRRGNPQNQQELRQMAIQYVAFEREAFEAGYSESQSLDGLEASTIVRSYQRGKGEEAMQLGKMSDQKCFTCQKGGHFSRDCYYNKNSNRGRGSGQNRGRGGFRGRGKGNQGNQGKPKKCYQCGNLGHIKPECNVPQNRWKKDDKRGRGGPRGRGGKRPQYTKTLQEGEGEEEKPNEESAQEYYEDFLGDNLADQN